MRRLVRRVQRLVIGPGPILDVRGFVDLSREVYPLAGQEPLPARSDLEERVRAGTAIRGNCPVCGKPHLFQRFTENLRDSGRCSGCGSSNRNRQLASFLRRRLGLPALGSIVLPETTRLYNAEANGPLHRALRHAPGYVCSEYFGPDVAGGSHVDGIRHEDLQRLSFPNESFDVVLTSDVLEHMPDPYAAHREIFRTLKRGGRHLFTVPFAVGAAADDQRARMEGGKTVYLKEKLWHVDPIRPDEGVLVWTIFGMEMLTRLERIGFVARMWILYEPRHGIIGPENTVFEALRPN